MPAELHLTSRLHAVIGLVAIVLLPAASWLDGSGQLAWTMFSRTGSFRLHVVAVDGAGRRRVIGPSDLAARASSLGRMRLAGSDHWRFHEVTRVTLRRHVTDLAQLACDVTKARSVELTLHDRPDLDTSSRAVTVRRRCAL